MQESSMGIVQHREKQPILQSLADSERFLGNVFLLPAVIFIIALVGVPFVAAIGFSVSDVTVGNTQFSYVGLKNFTAVMQTAQFQRALSNSILFTVVTQVFVIIGSTIIAEILTLDFRGKKVARFFIMMPWATPVALGAIAWLWLLDSKFSPFDWVLQHMHLLGPGTLFGPRLHMVFLGREQLAMASIVVVNVWRLTPLASVILLAGLTSISQDILDQANVDGSGFWRTLMEVKLPLILPIMSIAVLFGMVFTISDMAIVYIMTRGGPVYYTQVLPVWAYMKGIEGGSLGEGAAVALFLFPVLLAIVIFTLRASRRMEVT
jgi:ABC-type sugar transport system permease subunit